jgi:endonuclease/exonuclease/phosphatase family metal-dependent hydrolase
MPSGRRRTFPSAAPLFALDRVYLRGLSLRLDAMVPRGGWARMSDHLPLLVELRLD